MGAAFDSTELALDAPPLTPSSRTSGSQQAFVVSGKFAALNASAPSSAPAHGGNASFDSIGSDDDLDFDDGDIGMLILGADSTPLRGHGSRSARPDVVPFAKYAQVRLVVAIWPRWGFAYSMLWLWPLLS